MGSEWWLFQHRCFHRPPLKYDLFPFGEVGKAADIYSWSEVRFGRGPRSSEAVGVEAGVSIGESSAGEEGQERKVEPRGESWQ